MTENKTVKSRLVTFLIGLAMCLALLPAFAFAKPLSAADGTTIDTLEVGFRKVEVGDSLALTFDFVDETEKKLRVPENAQYEAKLTTIWLEGQHQRIWYQGEASKPWSKIEDTIIEKKVAYCFRVQFSPKTGYMLHSDDGVLKNKMKVLGVEAGKGKDIEIGSCAAQNTVTSAVEFDFYMSKGMTYTGYPQTIIPIINQEVSGKIGTLYTDTGFWIVGAPSPYTYEIKKYAPIGMEIEYSNIFGKSECYYRMTAVNSMMTGTLPITVTAADGQTCEIPLIIAEVSGGHEHQWSDYGIIDYEYHGYTKCGDPNCPGICYLLDVGSLCGKHDFSLGCNATCRKCGTINNPDAKHNYSVYEVDPSDSAYHICKCTCGEIQKDSLGQAVRTKHHGGVATCNSGGKCVDCTAEYLPKTGHSYKFKAFKNLDGTYAHLAFCETCGYEHVPARHSPTGGSATCTSRARCTYELEGTVCGCEYGNFLPHDFVNDVCTKCSSGKIVKDIEIGIPEFYRGMAYKALFCPSVERGNVIDLGAIFYKASFDRDANDIICNFNDCDTSYITDNSVMRYQFKPHTGCEFPEDLSELNVTLTNGRLLDKFIDTNGNLVLIVLLPLDDVVQAIDLKVSTPIAGSLPETLEITEKNGLEMTVSDIGPLIDGKFYLNVPVEATVKIKAPEGKKFPKLKSADLVSFNRWLCDFHLENAKYQTFRQSTDLMEMIFVLQSQRPVDCLHDRVTLKEHGKLPTCLEAGVKDKYVCLDCGKEFFDVGCTESWNENTKVIAASGHSPKSEYVADKDGHYHECKNCDAKVGLVAHDFTVLVPEVKATCTSKGVKAYYHCSVCDTYADENKNLIAKEDLEIDVNPIAHQFDFWKDEVPATTTEFGVKAHKDCVLCGKHFDASDKEILDLMIAKTGTYKVTVNGEVKFYAENETVTILADEPKEGQKFLGWEDETGKLVTVERSHTFTVDKEKTFTALYMDIPKDEEIIPPVEEKKGLSGGQIAGIVVGSTAAVSFAGFALYWFVFRKRF